MQKQKIIGREKERKILDRIWHSEDAEFVALYGRRRVGKTYLIRNYFIDKGIYFEASGAKDKPLKTQLENFTKAMSESFFKNIPLKQPLNWDDAFDLLTKGINSINTTQKVIVFLDELPWMATNRSGLIQSLDYYWNMYWSRLPNFILIVCGSAASWILEKLIYAKGGLHRRITKKILLEPYTLQETKEFLDSRSIGLNNKQVLDIYLAIGGIPFYLKAINKGMSAAQNLEELCFDKNGLLYDEFENIFRSLFSQADTCLSLVRKIAEHGNCISRKKLIELLGISSGGTLNQYLKELEASGFIQSFLPYGHKKRNQYFRIIDEFSLFHLKWIEPFIRSQTRFKEKGYWQNMLKTPSVSSWLGYAFENVCFKHLHQIVRALNLEHIACTIGNWQYIPKKNSCEDGAQIDLLFDRIDGIIILCEIKYTERPFVIDKTYAKKLQEKVAIFQKVSQTKKQLFLSMITTCGVKPSQWSKECIQNEIVLEDLFQK